MQTGTKTKLFVERTKKRLRNTHKRVLTKVAERERCDSNRDLIKDDIIEKILNGD